MKGLFKIEAQIKINKNGKRTLPIRTGYRPGFIFVDNTQTSGSISLLDREELKLGEEACVEVCFISDELLGDIKIGAKFSFFEGPVEIGKGTVINIFGWTE